MDAAGPLLQLHQQTSQIIIALPRSRCGAVTLNQGQADEREAGRLHYWLRVGGGGGLNVPVTWVAVVFLQYIQRALMTPFEHRSVSQRHSQVCRFNISS